MNSYNVIMWICIIVAGLFCYGKYFVATTELEKVNYGLNVMLWVIMGLIVAIIDKLSRLEKKL